MPLILGANSATGNYTVKNSLIFNSGSSDSLNRNFATSGNRKTFTISFWFKKSKNAVAAGQSLFWGDTAGTSNGTYDSLYFRSDDTIWFGGYNTNYVRTSAVYRDNSAWYHIMLSVDTTQATSTNRIFIYVNGVSQTLTQDAGFPAQNTDLAFTKSGNHNWFGNDLASGYENGYLAEAYLIDGQQLTPSSFGQTDPSTPSSGIWIPKAYTGTYGTNGFYLKFLNSASLGTDSSGNGNNFTSNGGIASTSQSTDTPTNNFCTMSPLIQFKGSGVSQTYSNGNLTVSCSSSYIDTAATFAVDKGKWFWEFKCLSSATTNQGVGIVNANAAQNDYSFNASNQYRYMANGQKNGTGGATSYGASYTTNDIIGVALDCDSGTLIFYKNGVSQGTAYTGLTNILFLPILVMYDVSITLSMGINFGSPYYSSNGYQDAAGYGNFSYAVPSGYYALCSANLAKYG